MALLLTSLLGVPAPTQSIADVFTVQAGAFVEGFQDFVTVASGVDPTDGTTYIVGRNNASQAVLRKYDSSGGRLIWEGASSETVTIPQINPSAMAVTAGSTNIFLAGGRVVLSFSKRTGLIVASADASAVVDFKGIFYWNNLIYVCGKYTSGSPFGHGATPRGPTSGLLIKMNASLVGGALALTTYGGTSGGTTAESVVVDEAGDVYVGGHMGSGSFELDGTIDLPGKWKVTVVKTDTDIAVDNLEQATNLVLNGNNATGTNTGFFDVINFGRYPTDGRIGGNDGFPGGWSERFALHASGSIWVDSPQTINFDSFTDDGTQLKVDNSVILTCDCDRRAGDSSGSRFLSRGLHSVDYIMWNHGGDSSAELWSAPNLNDFSTWSLLRSTSLPNTENKGYVLKFNGTTFSVLKNAYFSTTESAGQGGSFHQLNYSEGFVYAIGSWNGTADNPAIGAADTSAGVADIDIVKLDTALQLKNRATVKGLNSNEGYGVTADEAGNAYVTGSYGPASADFFGSADSAARPYAHLSASSVSIFVAKLDPNFNFQWVNKPSDPPPPFSLGESAPKVSWSPGLQRLFWVGYFGNSTLTLGQPNATISLTGPQSFVAVIDPDGKFTERVNLTVVSEFGASGTQIKPFGGPALSTNSPRTLVNTRPLIKGAQVAVTVPKYLYRDIHSNDITLETQSDASVIEPKAETRLTSDGYSVDDNVVTGTGNTYIFTLTKDTIVKFGWTIEHALRIQRDPFGTEGTDSPDTPGHILGLKSDAAGTPEPDVNKHWILQNKEVIAQINAEEVDLAYVAKGLPIKYVVTGYSAFGPPNTVGAAGETNFIPFVGSDRRYQISTFTMTGPAVIRYIWKLKIGVQVNTSGFKSAGYPLIHVQNDPGSQPPTQPDGAGSGTFYFDENSRLQIGSLANQTALQLKGWLNGDGIFAATGKTNNLSVYTVTGTNGPQTYLGQIVDKFTRPGRVMWDYGDRIFDETVYIGNPLTFGTVSDGIKNLLIMDQPPDRADVTEGPQGSSSGDMAIWDATGKKYYPLRPGILTSYWKMTSDPDDRIIVRITIKYADAPHYRHIANTPPVILDPATNDLVRFKALKYTEATTGAAVDSGGNFTATGRGKTVLLFGMLSSVGRQGQLETLRVRVVETKNWNDQLPATLPVNIGQKITSSYDTAQLDSGFVVFTNARYNPFIYDRQNVKGPIIPVNMFPNATEANGGQLVVVWYENRDKILWPYQPVRYDPGWPTVAAGLQRIVIASRYGSESVASNGTDQLVMPATGTSPNVVPEEVSYNPVRFQQVKIYNQPVIGFPGYNPNEEHALIAPSLRYADVSPRPVAAYALRDNDLNVTNRDASYTSDPYVLVQFFDSVDNEFKMKVYNVVRAATNLTAGELSYRYTFEQEMTAGEPVIPFYPLPVVIGATPCDGTYGRDGDPGKQVTFWKDHKGTAWAISGKGTFYMYFFYPFSTEFWWPAEGKQPGDCVAWLPNLQRGYANAFFKTNLDNSVFNYTLNNQHPPFQEVKYVTQWPDNVATLKVGETLTFAGGEYRGDNPNTVVPTDDGGVRTVDTEGLPGVLAWASGEIVFDSWNPVRDDSKLFTNYTARLLQAMEQRTVPLDIANFPATLNPANKRTKVQNGKFVFVELSSSLQKRVFYDPISGLLGIKGFLNDKDIGDPTLTAAPPAVYVLEPNIMTEVEHQELRALDGGTWASKVDDLYNLCRNPNNISAASSISDGGYRVGLEQKILRDSLTGLPLLTTNEFGISSVIRTNKLGAALQALGPGLALVSNPDFLDPFKATPAVSYVTLAENNHPSLGSAPVALHIVKVDRDKRYRGAIKTVLSANVFDENIILRHSGDFGANPQSLVFEWWYRADDGTDARPPDEAPLKWKLFADPAPINPAKPGAGFYQLKLKGNPSAPEVLLADTLFFVRYRHVNDAHAGVNWRVQQSNGSNSIPYQWAGAGNSSPNDLNGDGLPDYLPQLAQGWVKRVLDAVNPYEARINDFSGDNPATYSSMIRELGQKFEGPVALNPDKNVIENVGLIELYETILKRARDLSIDLSTPISTPGISTALQLASTRLSDFYMLLGNEAYVDAQNPTIGIGSGTGADLSGANPTYGNLASSVFAFQNQVSSLLDEELALLRGLDFFAARPVYNRLFWNFTKGEGEAAYAVNYNMRDVNNDGFINEADAQILYPQGHGDAWGHYLTAVKHQYDLLRNPFFNWVSRSERYNLQDIVIPVDFLDERKFAEAAAAKAKAGAEIVNMTYRASYVEDPDGQWQGYVDNNQTRAWGVDDWARRAGQGTYFDWVTANALLPAVHPNTNFTGIQKIDRTTVTEVGIVAANLVAIQDKVDEADGGKNPLGLANGALVFDLDPTFLFVGSTAQIGTRAVQGLLHFDQIFERALAALINAKAAFNYANQSENMLRQVANNEEEFRRNVYDQDLAYRNQLIEIFGTPYEGTIGSGKAYPAGYLGPDIMLYMYANVRDITTKTVPTATGGFTNTLINQVTSSGLIRINNSWRTDFAPTFSGSTSSDLYSNYVSNGNVEGYQDPALAGGNNVTNLDIPVTAAGYTFQAPPDWGLRNSPGELQSLVSQMVQAEADLAIEISNYGSWQSTIIRTMRLINARYDMNVDLRNLMRGQIAADTAFNAITLGFGISAAVQDVLGDAVQEEVGDAAAEGIPKNGPIAGLAVGFGDLLAPIRMILELAGGSSGAALHASAVIDKFVAETSQFAKGIADMVIELEKFNVEKDFELKEALNELQNNILNDNTRRLEIFRKEQVLNELTQKYRGTLAKGFRLVQERVYYNKKVAAITQQNRYQDMTLRVTRNAAMEKYRSAFDLAARYTYLAASAYDYDTNLRKNDAGSPLDIRADIVRQRTIGIMNDNNQPASGGGGLAENLAWLKANYESLKFRMGLNNYEQEAATFSLRTEHFRTLLGTNVTSDAKFKEMLGNYPIYRTNLWDVPEFRLYCRPFTSETNGPQPGLVIEFSTEIKSGKNFFGWPLSGGDNAYNPSMFATKIDQVGVWFANYDTDNLAAMPRVYLIPVGQDVMTVPTSQDLEVRIWNVVDEAIPVPFPTISASLSNPAWRPLRDSLSGPFQDIHRFSSILAAGFNHAELTDTEAAPLDYRLVGRSAWNTRWMLIIPGATLSANQEEGLQNFLKSVTDIKIVLLTYGSSGN